MNSPPTGKVKGRPRLVARAARKTNGEISTESVASLRTWGKRLRRKKAEGDEH
jgi:hypothetical protein